MVTQAQATSERLVGVRRLIATLMVPVREPGGSALLRRSHWIGAALVTVLALAVAVFRIDRPSPWADEAVTTLVVRGDWSGIPPLLGGADAPLVPYYVLAKAWAALFAWLPTLTAVRLLSALAAALTVWVLYELVARRVGVGPAAVISLMLISFPGWSRYGQEARPYALLVLMATVLWLAWDSRPPAELTRFGSGLRGSGWLGWLPYLAALGGSVVFHLFGLFQWPAQLLADITTPGVDRRLRVRRLAQSVTAMAVAAVAFGLPVAIGALRGTGAPRVIPLTVKQLVLDFAVVIQAQSKVGALIPVLVLIVIALLAVVFRLPAARRYAELVWVAVIWAAVPLVLSVLAAVLRPSLLRSRYWMPAVVPLAILAGVGTLVLAGVVWHALRGWADSPRGVPAVRVVAAMLALLIGFGAQAYVSIPQQRSIRSEAGHAQRAKGALATMKELLARYPGMPVGTSPFTRSTILWAMDDQLEAVDVLQKRIPNTDSVWPVNRPTEEVNSLLTGHDQLVWMRAIIQSTPRPTLPPKPLQELGFRVVSAEKHGSWWVCIVERG